MASGRVFCGKRKLLLRVTEFQVYTIIKYAIVVGFEMTSLVKVKFASTLIIWFSGRNN